jgi:sugar lactone lactonase YvrE
VDVRTGAARQVVKGTLAMPLGIAAVSDGAKDTLYIADVFALRRIDAAGGQVTDIARSHAADTPIGYPIAVTANQRHVIVTNNEGPVQRYERSSMRLLQSWRDTHAGNAIEMPSGALVIAETTRGKLTRIAADANGEQRTQIVADLIAPVGLAIANENAVYVSEMVAGQLSRIHVSSGARQVIAKGLDRPQGIATDSDGTVLVVEAGRKQLVRIDPRTDSATVIARELPVGLVPTTLAGVAVGASGVLYVSSDVENSVWRLRRKR